MGCLRVGKEGELRVRQNRADLGWEKGGDSSVGKRG